MLMLTFYFFLLKLIKSLYREELIMYEKKVELYVPFQRNSSCVKHCGNAPV